MAVKSPSYHWRPNLNLQYTMDLVTVLEAILMSRQLREKLQCLYENLMSPSFHKMTVLK